MAKKKAENPNRVAVVVTGDTNLTLRSNPTEEEVRKFVTEVHRRHHEGIPSHLSRSGFIYSHPVEAFFLENEGDDPSTGTPIDISEIIED